MLGTRQRAPLRARAGRVVLGGLLFGLVLVLTSACQAVTRVTVAVGPAGDGTVTVALTLDKAATAQVPDLASRLRLNDLRRAGWSITGPAATADGGQRVAASIGFRDPAGAAAALSNVTGPAGPLNGLRIERHRSFATTRTRLAGTVDLRGGVDVFADSTLARQLGVPSLAAALSALHQAGSPEPDLRLEIAARLPGGIHHSNASRVNGGTAVWTPQLGQSLAVDVSASQRNLLNLGLAGVCLLSVLTLAAVVLRRTFGFGLGLSGRRDRWEIGDGRPRRAHAIRRRGRHRHRGS